MAMPPIITHLLAGCLEEAAFAAVCVCGAAFFVEEHALGVFSADAFGVAILAAHARTQVHQPVSPIHCEYYALIRQKRGDVIAGGVLL